jgi:gamma-glutamylcyclotransferase
MGSSWGGLWAIPADRIPALDRAEGVHKGVYRREILRVETDRGLLETLVYIEDFIPTGEPRDGYVPKILAGAVEFGLPDWYQHEPVTWV